MNTLTPIPPPQWPSSVRRKCESYLDLLRQAQPLSVALAKAKQTNDVAALKCANDKLDSLQVSIFRALRRKTTQDAFDEGGVSVADLAVVCAPGRPEVSLATTMLTVVVSQQVAYFNVGKTMNAVQVGMVVDDIMDRFSYMTLEEVSTALATARRTANVYDRLDPNTIIGWIYDYDSKRDEYCELRAQRDVTASRQGNTSAMTYEEYERWLIEEVKKGNKEAIRAKEDHDAVLSRKHQKENEEKRFQEWKQTMGL